MKTCATSTSSAASRNTPQWCAVCRGSWSVYDIKGSARRGLSVHGGCQLKAHAVFDCVGRSLPKRTAALMNLSSRVVAGQRSPSGDAIFVDDVEEGVGRLELHLASVA